jgi:Obg family GTPase CgtA
MPFRDVIEITAQGGRGGDGAMSFLRLKYIPKGGPDGGHGGDGGSVWLEAVDALNSLDALGHRRTYKAPSGNPGEGREKAGSAGGDLTLSVPVGTLVFDLDTGERIGDLVEVGERLQVAAGGQGGRGNASFASSRRQAPRFSEAGSRASNGACAWSCAPSATSAWSATPTPASRACWRPSPTPGHVSRTTRSRRSTPSSAWSSERGSAAWSA